MICSKRVQHDVLWGGTKDGETVPAAIINFSTARKKIRIGLMSNRHRAQSSQLTPCLSRRVRSRRRRSDSSGPKLDYKKSNFSLYGPSKGSWGRRTLPVKETGSELCKSDLVGTAVACCLYESVCDL